MNRQISDTLHLLWSQYNEEEFCNVTVHCHDEKRFCNSFMLMTLSQFWTEVISDSNTADSTIHVMIPDVNAQTFDNFVKIILTGDVSVPNGEVNNFIADIEELVPDVDLLLAIWTQSISSLHPLRKPRTTKFKRNKRPDCSHNCPLHCPDCPNYKEKEKEIPKPRKTIQEFKTNPLVCKYCLKTFYTEANCTRHIESCHKMTKDSLFKCKVCDKEYTTKYARDIHENEHKKKSIKFVCPTCGNLYKRHSDLIKHIKSKDHEYPEPGLYPDHENIGSNIRSIQERCDICHRNVAGTEIELHKKIHHSKSSRYFPCNMCNYKTDRADKLRRHEYLKHKIADREFKYIDKTFEKEDKETTDWQCIECKKLFPSFLEMENHMLLRHCEELRCTICNKEFKLKHCLTQHMKHIHGNGKKFKCKKCGAYYSYKSSFNRHNKTCKK